MTQRAAPRDADTRSLGERRPRPASSRAKGMAKMEEVYGFKVDPADVPGDYTAITVDHLFGTVWTRPALDLRERRLLTIGTLAALGLGSSLEIQFACALERGELDVEQSREVVIHLTHYVGWPLSTTLAGAAERAIASAETNRSERRAGDGPVTFDFNGKVAVVTGAGGGIGQAYAEALARSGASVLVADIDEASAGDVARGIARGGGRAVASRVDVAEPQSAAAMAETAVVELRRHRLSGQQCRHLRWDEAGPPLSVDWEYLQRFMAVNLLGALNCTRACYQPMRSRGGGSIVNQSSTAAYVYAGFYGLAKAGINSLTQQLAHELGGMNIRVNAIAPGPIDTEAARATVPEVFIDQIVANLALKRQGTPADLVGMCQFLLSDDAAWVTGHVFNVDGGQVMRA